MIINWRRHYYLSRRVRNSNWTRLFFLPTQWQKEKAVWPHETKWGGLVNEVMKYGLAVFWGSEVTLIGWFYSRGCEVYISCVFIVSYHAFCNHAFCNHAFCNHHAILQIHILALNTLHVRLLNMKHLIPFKTFSTYFFLFTTTCCLKK